MDPADFKKLAKDVIDYIVDYTETIRERKVLPSVKPGYLHRLVPSEAPKVPDDWRQILPDVEELIMPGITHWISPMFNAYCSSGNSYPSIIGELISAGIGCIGINWITSPACTELEVIVLDWLAKLMGLPEFFLASNDGPGGGVIHGSASEGILVALLVAKEKTARQVVENNPSFEVGAVKDKLVAYSSDQANSAIEKAGLLGSMKTRLLPSDDHGRLRGDVLAAAIEKDKALGLIPCYVIATLGTTGTCAFDNLMEIGPVCHREGVWLHVDAAYAGILVSSRGGAESGMVFNFRDDLSRRRDDEEMKPLYSRGAALICPEYRHLMRGIEWADSINMNPHKWLLVNFDCSAFWIKNRKYLYDLFLVDRIYLWEKEHSVEKWAPEFRNWEIPLGRRFRALKLWITLRLYGEEGLQKVIRTHIGLAEQFQQYVKQDPRFELVSPASMGLVCFRLKGDSQLTRDLLKSLTEEKEIFLNQGQGTKDGKYFLCYAVCSRLVCLQDVQRAWKIITSHADSITDKKLNGIMVKVEAEGVQCT